MLPLGNGIQPRCRLPLERDTEPISNHELAATISDSAPFFCFHHLVSPSAYHSRSEGAGPSRG
jgi:hypothetical protein